MATTDHLRVHRIAILTGLLVGLAILLGTDEPRGGPYILLGLAFLVAVHGYVRTRMLGGSNDHS
jgi:hypothetical protein